MPSNRITPGGTAITGRALNLTSFPVTSATTGTDTTPSATTTYYVQLYVPGDTFVTGVRVLLGSASNNGNVVIALYDEAGSLLANTALAGTSTGASTAVMLSVPLTVPFTVTGPRYLIVATQWSSTSDRFRSIPAQCDNGCLAGSQTGTVVGTLPAPLTISTTAFTADKGNIVALY